MKITVWEVIILAIVIGFLWSKGHSDAIQAPPVKYSEYDECVDECVDECYNPPKWGYGRCEAKCERICEDE